MTDEKPKKAGYRPFKRVNTVLAVVAALAVIYVLVTYLYPSFVPRDLESLKAETDRIVVIRNHQENSYKESDVIFEVADAAEVAEVMKNIQIETEGDRYSTYPGPTIFFYRGEKKLSYAELVLGTFLRGPVFTKLNKDFVYLDSVLTPQSRRWVCDWLARHGETIPRREMIMNVFPYDNWHDAERRLKDLQWDEDRIRSDVLKRKIKRFKEILPEEAFQPIREFEQGKVEAAKRGIPAALRSAYPDESERLRLLFRLYGAVDSPWGIDDEIDQVLYEQIENFDTEMTAGISLSDLTEDLVLARGVARWAFLNRRYRAKSKRLSEEVVEFLVEAKLRSEYRSNRWSAMAYLRGSEEITHEFRTKTLKQIMNVPKRIGTANANVKDPHTVVDIQKRNERYLGFLLFVKKRGIAAPIDASDRAAAAFVLGMLGDKESLPEIKKLLETANETDKEVLQDAVYMLETE